MLTLALGMGATTTIISVVNSVLLRPLPYKNSGRLLRVQETHPGDPGANLTYATFSISSEKPERSKTALPTANGFLTSHAAAASTTTIHRAAREL